MSLKPPSEARFRPALLAPRHWGVWLALGLLWLLSFLPRRLLALLAGSISRLAPQLNRKRWQIARRNLELCYPDRGTDWHVATLRRHFHILTLALLDLGTLWLRSPRRLARLGDCPDCALLDQALAGLRPVIMMTPHSPALDHGGQWVAHYLEPTGAGLISMYKPQGNPVLAWLMYRRRVRHGVVLVPRNAGLRPVIRFLRQHPRSIFFYLPDEDHGPKHSVFAPFCGVQKATLPALGGLARITGAVVLPAFMSLDPYSGRYRIHCQTPLANFPTGDEQEDARRMNAAIEALIAEDPAQYMWVYKLFRTRPAGQPDLYSKL